MSSPCLPGEVWTLVFGHLPVSDRLRVRATCKYFRDLVDNSDLWRDWTVELGRSGDEYEEDYWDMLRRWRVTSARLLSVHSCAHISKELPGLTTVTVQNRDFTDTQMPDLKGFANLERLHLTLPCNVLLEEFSLFLPQRLTHLRMCLSACINSHTLPAEIPPDSLFKKLKSFTLHCKFHSHPVNVLHFFLSSLPQLQHLSLLVYTHTSYEGLISDLPPLHNCSLSSLELVECNLVNLPMDLMKMLTTLPFLRSLAIFCINSYCNDLFDGDKSQKLSTWLQDLPDLSSLVVECSDVSGFVGSIPSSVTRLTLLPAYINSKAMTALSIQLPHLRHLYLDPYHTCLGSGTALIPQLFPRLKTLRLSLDQVSEDAFLSLASLKELEVLETLNLEPPAAALVSKLRALTNNRVRIYKRSEKSWLRSCLCSSLIPTDYWAQV